VYVGVGLYRPGITRGRGTANDVVCITSLWADLDYGGEHKKDNLPPDEAACRKILERIGLKPSLIVHSGHGLQPYWLLKESLTAQEGASRIAARWGATIQAHAKVLGYNVDSVWDLARVLRVPGTWNYKFEPMPVRGVE
jgi:putative DNA primase/helicase